MSVDGCLLTDLRYSRILRNMKWRLLNDVSGQRIGPIFKGQEIPKTGKTAPTGCPETSVRIYHSTLRKIPQRRWYRLHRGGSLKYRMFQYSYKIGKFFNFCGHAWGVADRTVQIATTTGRIIFNYGIF